MMKQNFLTELSDSLNRYQNNFKNRYQNNFESMKGSEFVFHYVHLLYYKCHEIYPNCDGSSIDSPDWIKKKK